VPPSSAVLVWDKADASPGGAVIPLGTGGGGLCHVDHNGIWWMSDCYGDVPWPASYNSASPPTPLGQDTTPPTCPRPEEMKLHLWFAEMLVATDKTVVTSLAAAPGSPLRIANCDGDPASTGALVADLDLAFLTDADLVAGPLVFKSIDGTTFKRGYVVEALEPGSNVTLTPTLTVAGGRAAGTVRVDVNTGLADRLLTPQIVRVSNVRERLYQDVPADNQAILVPQRGMHGDPDLPATSPKTYGFLNRFAGLLAARSSYRRYQSGQPIWSTWSTGAYTFAPFKVVWQEMSGGCVRVRSP
jgi:hypothetical protein